MENGFFQWIRTKTKTVFFTLRLLYHVYLNKLFTFLKTRHYEKLCETTPMRDYRYSFSNYATYPFTRLVHVDLVPSPTTASLDRIRDNIENMGTFADEITLDDLIYFCDLPIHTNKVHITCFHHTRYYETVRYVIDKNTPYCMKTDKK